MPGTGQIAGQDRNGGTRYAGGRATGDDADWHADGLAASDAGWQRVAVGSDAVLLHRPVGGTASLLLANPAIASDATGRSLFNCTFVCQRQPAQENHDTLRGLIDYAALGFDVTAAAPPSLIEAANLSIGSVAAARIERTVLSITDATGALVAETAFTERGAISATMARAQAQSALDAMMGPSSDLSVTTQVTCAPPPGGETATWQCDLGAVSAFLATKADDGAIFFAADLDAYLPMMIDEGLVERSGNGGGMPISGALQAFLRAALPILAPAGEMGSAHQLGPAYVFRSLPAGGMTVTFRTEGAGEAPPIASMTTDLSALFGGMGGTALDPSHTQFVVHDGRGRMTGLDRRLRSGRARSGKPTPTGQYALQAGRLNDLSAAIRPSVAAALRPEVAVLSPSIAANLIIPPLVALPLGDEVIRSLPISDGPGPLWPDRKSAKKVWYEPIFSIPADGSGFGFSFKRVGHDFEGRTGLEGRVTYKLEGGPSAEAKAAIGKLAKTVKAVAVAPLGLSAKLELPFRNERGETVAETFTADTVTLDGNGDLSVAFSFTDQWARIAYGALAYDGFQERPPALIVSYRYAAYRKKAKKDRFRVAAGGKTIGLALDRVVAARGAKGSKKKSLSHRRRDGSVTALGIRPQQADDQVLALSPAQLPAAIAYRPELYAANHLIAPVQTATHVEITRSKTHRLDTVMACDAFGHAYREDVDDEMIPVGCQEAFRLGETPHRLYAEIALPASLSGYGRVYRVLSSPGRFLIVPARYVITRHPHDDEQRGGEPCVLLFSTIDIDDLAKSRCVIAATVAPDLNLADRARLLDHLRRQYDPNAVLDPVLAFEHETRFEWSLPTGPDSALALAIEAVEAGDGFEVTVTTDAFGLPQIAQIMQLAGVAGSVRLSLSDGTDARAGIVLDLSRITGPAPDGPFTVNETRGGPELVNALGVPVRLDAILSLNDDGLIEREDRLETTLAPGGTHLIGLDAGRWVADAAVSETAPIPEIRSFAEDVTIAVLVHDLVTQTDTIDRADVVIDVPWSDEQTTISFPGDASDGAAAAENVVGDEAMREARFALPLTTFLDDPFLTLTITTHAADGPTTHPAVRWNLGTDGYYLALSKELIGLE